MRILLLLTFVALTAGTANAQSNGQFPSGPALPFPATPSASKAGTSLKESTHQWRVPEKHLNENAPNIVVIMLDDVGFGQSATYGGPINTLTLSRIAKHGCFV